LAAALRDEDIVVRAQAAWALARMEGKARDALPLLIEIIDAFDVEQPNLEIEWEESAEIVGLVEVALTIDPNFNLVPNLIRFLKHPSPSCRVTAMYSISAMGMRAGDAVPAVAAMLNDSDRDCRLIAARMLEEIAPPDDAFAHLLRAFEREDDETVRRTIAEIANRLDREMTSPRY
jgi:HEAT repeat protein